MIGTDTLCQTANTTGPHVIGTNTLGKTANTTGPDSFGPSNVGVRGQLFLTV